MKSNAVTRSTTKATQASRWRPFAVCTVLAFRLGIACATQLDKVTEFIAVAKSQLKTAEAVAALRDGPPEEYFRWGEQGCMWVRTGKANFEQVTENLASFFGEDLSAALVFAARKTVCPELK